MIFSILTPLLLLPLAAANGIHRLKLKKLPPTIGNIDLESAYLAGKYGGRTDAYNQVPLLGSGRNGRVDRPCHNEDELRMNGGHSVPLTSKPPNTYTEFITD